MQLPPTHVRLTGHAGCAPHLHMPFTQLSAFVVLQDMHMAPFVPQAVKVGGVVHIEPAQQPVMQVVASQMHIPP